MKRVLVLLIGEVLEDPRVYRTCRSLAETGATVTVACTNPSGRPFCEQHDSLMIERFPHRSESVVKRLYLWLKGTIHPSIGGALGRGHEEVTKSPLKSMLRNLLVGLNYRHFERENRKINRLMIGRYAGETFDLVHCNDADTLTAGCELRKSGAAKELLYDAHEYWPGIGVHGSGPNEAISAAEKRGIACADYIVTVNPLIADRIRDENRLDRTPSVVMNCPYKSDEPDAALVVNDPVRVIYQGKLQAFRGLDELVTAFRDIEGAVLTLSGYGPLEESLERLAASLGLSDRVTFAGRYTPAETISILAGHDIGVMPFRDVTDNIRLSSPNKLFDYIMAGLAIASSDLPFIGRVVREHNAGKLFPDTTPGGIADTLNSMIRDRDGLLLFRQNARKAVDAGFSWEHQFRNYPWRP